jgi:hypothetical protein
MVSRQFGLIGALVGMAMAGFSCTSCGEIPRSEFPSDVRSQMMLGSLAMVGGAIVVLGLLVVFLIAVNR